MAFRSGCGLRLLSHVINYNANNLASRAIRCWSVSRRLGLTSLRGPHVTKCSTRPDRRQRDRQRYGFRLGYGAGARRRLFEDRVSLRDCRLRDEIITPACSVSNYGTTVEGTAIPSHTGRNRSRVSLQQRRDRAEREPRTAGYVLFSAANANWPRGGPYTVRCSTELTTDLNRGNNSAPPRAKCVEGLECGT